MKKVLLIILSSLVTIIATPQKSATELNKQGNKASAKRSKKNGKRGMVCGAGINPSF